MGSFLIIPAKVDKNYENFDYLDIYKSLTLLLRVDDICFITVLNDSCASSIKFKEFLERHSGSTGSMSPLQLREVAAHLAFINLKLKERPEFKTKIDLKQNKCSMLAHHPDFVELDNYEKNEFGEILDFCCKDLLNRCTDNNINIVKEQVKQGEVTFLFDEKGEFNNNSFIPV